MPSGMGRIQGDIAVDQIDKLKHYTSDLEAALDYEYNGLDSLREEIVDLSSMTEDFYHNPYQLDNFLDFHKAVIHALSLL